MSTSAALRAAARQFIATLRGNPPRYRDGFVDGEFGAQLEKLTTGTETLRVLDVGAGATPTLPRGQRQVGWTYTGMDISSGELDRADPSSYDKKIVGDVCCHDPRLRGSFDLVVSFQVLEHVRDLEAALANMHDYLAPGGAMLVQFSGGRTPIAVVNLALPIGLSRYILHRLRNREPASVFPAIYDRCYYDAIARMTAGWTQCEVRGLYSGCHYCYKARMLQALYVFYEELAVSLRWRNQATYYLLRAQRT